MQTVYTIAELGALIGMSRRRTLAFLRHSGVPIRQAGPRKFVVLLSALKATFPELWASIRERRFLEEEDE